MGDKSDESKRATKLLSNLEASRELLRGPEHELKRVMDEFRGTQLLQDEVRRMFRSPLEEIKALTTRSVLSEDLFQVRELYDLGSASAAIRAVQLDRNTALEDMRRWYDEQFRRPYQDEIAQLMAQFQRDPVADYLSQHKRDMAAELEATLAAMRSPYLGAETVLQSVAAFAELHSIGQAISEGRAFELEFVDALRIDLGDWRDPVAWNAAALDDAPSRVEVYVEMGVDTGLADFPSASFQEVLERSGLRPRELLVSPVSGEANLDVDQLDRSQRAFAWLMQFERRMRVFIDQVMTRTIGPDWIRKRVKPDLREAWQAKHETARKAGMPRPSLLDYSDFCDYVRLITQRDNWSEAFAGVFLREENVRESFQRLYPVRHCVMHSGLLTQEDELLLYAEIRRLDRAMGG